MAHVGRWIPRLMYPDHSPLNEPIGSPPYRMRIICSPFSTGLQCALWEDVDMVSQEPSYSSPATKFLYKFQCPNSVFLQIWVTWELQNTPTITANLKNLEVKLFLQFIDGGVEYATETAMLTDDDLALGSNRLYYQFTTWTTSIDRGIVDKMNDCRICAARWQDVPDYKPRKLH